MPMGLVELVIAALVGGALFVCFAVFGPRRDCNEDGGCGNCSGHCATRREHDGHA